MTGLSRSQVLEAVHAGMIRTLPEEKRGQQYVLEAPSVEEFVRAPDEWQELVAYQERSQGGPRPVAA